MLNASVLSANEQIEEKLSSNVVISELDSPQQGLYVTRPDGVRYHQDALGENDLCLVSLCRYIQEHFPYTFELEQEIWDDHIVPHFPEIAEGEGSTDDNFENLVCEIICKIRQDGVMSNGRIQLFRMLALSDTNSLRNGVGIYWAFTPDKAKVYASSNREGLTDRLLSASFLPSDIDWLQTFALYIGANFKDNELRLFENSVLENAKLDGEAIYEHLHT